MCRGKGDQMSRRDLLAGTSATLAALPATARPTGDTGFGRLRRVAAGDLDIAYLDRGPTTGPAVILLHGWPYDIHAFSDCASLLIRAGRRVIIPYLRGFGATCFRSAGAMRNGQQAVLARDVVELMNALRIERATIAGFDWGARSACIMAALWPERCEALVSVSGYLIGSQQAGRTSLDPEAEHRWWYQFYFATERGRDGYARNRAAFNRLIWQLASPKWRFDEATYARSAAAFDNPDHVAIVIHNYRWRLGLAQGDATLADLERLLATAPSIAVPAITLEGDANGAPHPEPGSYRLRFTGPHAHRLIRGGIGHALPQEAPQAFANAVLSVVALR